ncbi:acyltransferase [bacterium]|nr:acyltransferase [bacterium]
MNVMKSHHYPALDGVRGLAILLVIFFHSTQIPLIGILDKVWQVGAFAGWVGVDIFFVLSGFLITDILLREKTSENYFLNFYAKRVLRIFPLYYLFLFFMFFVFHQRPAFGFTYWTFLSNILVSRLGYFPAPMLDATWSLALEEQFYLIWPLVVYFCETRKMRLVCMGLFFTALFLRIFYFLNGANPLTNYVLLATRMDSLSAGAFLALTRSSGSTIPWKRILAFTAVPAACVFLVDVSHSAPWMQTVGFSLNAIMAMSLLGILLQGPPVGISKVFESLPLRVLGKYSYGMYLLHVPVIHWVFQAAEPFWKSAGSRLGMGFPIQILFQSVAILTTLLLAFVLYHVYEKHFLKLKKYFLNAGPTTATLCSQT